MKHGPQSTLEPIQLSKKARREENEENEENIKELMDKVYRGEFKDFKSYVNHVKFNGKLDLEAQNIDDDKALRIAEVLPFTNLKSLDLSLNQIGPAGAEAIARSLKGNTSLTSLNLSSNKLGVASATLVHSLKGTKVAKLDLGDNEIGDDGAEAIGKALPGTNVTKIFLPSNGISAAGAKALGEALRETQVILLHLWNNIIGDDGAKYLGEALRGTRVISLDLSENDISAVGAKFLGDVLSDTSVQRLNLEENKIDSAGAKAFIEDLRRTNVFSLYLKGNFIGQNGEDTLAGAVSGTCLLEMEVLIDWMGTSLKEALSLNQQKIVLTPYYATGLRFVSDAVKNCYPSNRLNPDKEIEYAGGILMNLPPELFEFVIRFLPGMDAKLKNGKNRSENYVKLFESYHQELLEVQNDEMEVERDTKLKNTR